MSPKDIFRTRIQLPLFYDAYSESKHHRAIKKQIYFQNMLFFIRFAILKLLLFTVSTIIKAFFVTGHQFQHLLLVESRRLWPQRATFVCLFGSISKQSAHCCCTQNPVVLVWKYCYILKPSDKYLYHVLQHFQNFEFCKTSIFVFSVILKINSGYFLKQHSLLCSSCAVRRAWTELLYTIMQMKSILQSYNVILL
jgi:hypothetical protein